MKQIANVGFIIIEFFIDYLRALKWSKSSPLCPNVKKHYYEIILLAHTVEKGLSIKNPRMKFGQVKIPKLLSHLEKYGFDNDLFPVQKSYGCLNEYIQLHKKNNFNLGEMGEKINIFLQQCDAKKIVPTGGTKKIVPTIDNSFSFHDGLLFRFSSRQYIPTVVSEEILNKIIEISLRTPSQCNRQSGRVHYYSNKNVIDQLLKLQGGAEGFREDVYNLFVITSDISAWSGFKARSQAYVDGSLLAMQVLNACFANNIGSCPLSLAVSNKRELQISKTGNIPTNERLIMMISFGYQKENEYVVARSERISTTSLMTKH